MLTLETPTCSGQDRTAILIARLKWVAFATLAIGWLIFAAVFASVGLFTLDESIYLLLLHASAYGGHLTIWNGYEEIPSAALRLGHLAAGPHGLTPEPPSGWGFLAAPFYRLAGIRAIELLNTLAAIATLLFTYRISLSLYHNRRLSLNAALLLGFATFLAEYAFGVWPHATSVAMETGSALCVLLAAEKDSRKAILWVALGGLILGSALQFRVSAILVAPPLIAWLLITQRERLLLPLVYVLGAVPGLAVSTFLNDYKFGSLSPLSYGVVHGAASASSYAGLAAVGIGIGLLALLLTHRPVRTRMRASHLWLIAGLLVLAALAAPPLRDMVERIAKGVWVLVVDLQAYDHVGQELGVERDPSGVVLFFGVLKRAFLQSIPWGALLVIPIAQAIRRRDLPAHLFSFLIIGAWIAPFAYMQWHGGFALNMRYFLPLLPFVAILAAVGIEHLWQAGESPRLATLSGVLLGIFALMGTLFAAGQPYEIRATWLLTLPLLLAAGLGVTALLTTLIPQQHRFLGYARYSARLVTTGAIVWSGGTAYLHDAWLSQTLRELNEHHQEAIAPYVPDDALTLSVKIQTLVPLKLHRNGLRIGILHRSTPKDVANLIVYHARRGTPIFLNRDIAVRVVEPILKTYGYAPEIVPEPAGCSKPLLFRLKHLGVKAFGNMSVNMGNAGVGRSP